MKVRNYVSLKEKIEIFKEFNETGEKLIGNTVYKGYPIGTWAVQIRSKLNRKSKGKSKEINVTNEQLDVLQGLGILTRQKGSTIDEKIDMLIEWTKKYPEVEIGQKIPENVLRKYATNGEEYSRIVAEYEKMQRYYGYVRQRKSTEKLTSEQISKCKEGNVRGVFGYPTQVEELARKTGKSEQEIEYIIINYGTMANFISLYRKGELSIEDDALASSMLRNVIDIDLESDSDKTDKLYYDIMEKTYSQRAMLELYSSERLKKMLETLQPREEYVLKRRYGLLSDNLPTSLRNIADEMKVSGEMVRQIVQRALRKMKDPSKLKEFSINLNEIDMLTEDERKMLEDLKNRLYASDAIFCRVPISVLQQDSGYDKILGYFSFVKNMNAITEERRDKREQEFLENRKNNPEEARKINIQELEFSIGARTALRAARIKTLGDIVQFTKRDLMKKRGIGSKRLSEIMKIIGEYGLTLREDVKTAQTKPENESEGEIEASAYNATNENEFVVNIVSHAKKREELKTQEEKAAELEKQYEEQVSENEHLLDDGSK